MKLKKISNQTIKLRFILKNLNGFKDKMGTKCYHDSISYRLVLNYLNIVFDKARKGETVFLPSNFGELKIVKKPNKTKHLKRWKAAINKPIKLVPHRMGYSYQHTIDSELMKNQHYSFGAADAQRKKLHKLLLETTIDFETRNYEYPKKPWLSGNSYH